MSSTAVLEYLFYEGRMMNTSTYESDFRFNFMDSWMYTKYISPYR